MLDRFRDDRYRAGRAVGGVSIRQKGYLLSRAGQWLYVAFLPGQHALHRHAGVDTGQVSQRQGNDDPHACIR